jgi:hypothetical protein
MKKKWINRTLWLVAFAPKADFEIATSGAVLSYIVGTNYHFPKPLLYALFVFFATLFMYNLMRGANLWRETKKEPDINKLLDVTNHYGFAAGSGVVAGILFLFVQLPYVYYMFTALLLIISLLYRFRWMKIGSHKTAISDVPYMKLFVLATVWMLMTTYLPQSFSASSASMMIGAWLMFFALGIPFDVRDVVKDDPSRKTIAQVLGKSKALLLSVLLFSASILLLIEFGFNKPSIYALILIVLYSITIYFTYRYNQKEVFYRLIDISPLFWALLLLF